jgi:hypothetical protein
MTFVLYSNHLGELNENLIEAKRIHGIRTDAANNECDDDYNTDSEATCDDDNHPFLILRK